LAIDRSAAAGYDNRIDLRPHLRVLERAKWLVLTFTLSATLTSLALTYVFAEKYAARRRGPAGRRESEGETSLGFSLRCG
jgi:uncharacterized protein involved in exopolysaccharide biosynthesis